MNEEIAMRRGKAAIKFAAELQELGLIGKTTATIAIAFEGDPDDPQTGVIIRATEESVAIFGDGDSPATLTVSIICRNLDSSPTVLEFPIPRNSEERQEMEQAVDDRIALLELSVT